MEEEGNKKQILHGECPTKLNLNMPPLSTRRPFAIKTNKANNNASIVDMVPFSWERIPGEPKDKNINDDIEPPLTPKLPPGWRPPTTAVANPRCDYSDKESRGGKHGPSECSSNAIDVFSLGESTDDTELSCREVRKDGSSEILMGHHSPNFIIERFLPDAQALAEASVINKKLPVMLSPDSIASFSREVGIESSCSSPKGCGFGSLLPWRMKPKPCSVKSPVRDTIVGPIRKRTDNLNL